MLHVLKVFLCDISLSNNTVDSFDIQGLFAMRRNGYSQISSFHLYMASFLMHNFKSDFQQKLYDMIASEIFEIRHEPLQM